MYPHHVSKAEASAAPIDNSAWGAAIPEELRNSTEKILRFADVPRERAELFMVNLDSFRKLREKHITDPGTRKIRQVITTIFLEVYGSVLKKVLAEKDESRLYLMFLHFGYMDEKLLRPEQTVELYHLLDQPGFSKRISVYSIKDWLEKIYTQEKDPSVNEFGMDYYDVFREMKKRGEVTDRDKHQYDNDTDNRLQHEINNLLRVGQRLCCGQMGAYFPVLHSGMITRDLSKAMVTPELIEASLDKLLEVDYSAFHREIVYSQPEKGITKELIMKPVLPEFILMPTFGSRAAMWQELTGRVRTSPGRFIFPLFISENLGNLIVEVVGRFRWELSKTMSSYTRSDQGQSSLAADYIDYIQFYRKNRELSDEAKGKIKSQIEKYRNNAGEIFAADYQTWINYESKGLLRLNKIARGILFKHCPFSRPVREKLVKQPLYSQLISRFDNLKMKEARLIEARYARMVKPGHPFDPELEHNLRFYKEM